MFYFSNWKSLSLSIILDNYWKGVKWLLSPKISNTLGYPSFGMQVLCTYVISLEMLYIKSNMYKSHMAY